MKTTILGSACVITSSVKFDDLKTLAKYKPNALTVWEKDEDGVKTPVFMAAVKEGFEGTVGENGAIFGKASPEGYAQITMLVNAPKGADLKEFVAEQCGTGLLKLAKWEETVPAVIDALNADKAAVLDAIEVTA